MRIQSVPVCMYHHINEHSNDFITVTTENFRRQMIWLRENEWLTLSAADLRAYKLGQRNVPKKSVSLTFDDAWLDVYVNAWPILRELEFRFTIFVITRFTERASINRISTLPSQFPSAQQANDMTKTDEIGNVSCGWEHLEEMLRSGLCSIESHTASHNHKLIHSPSELRRDITEAKDSLRQRLGIESRQLCWPKGRYTQDSLQVAHELGIDTTYLVRRGANLPTGNAMKVRRFTVDDKDERWFEKQLNLFSSPIYGTIYAALKPDRWFSN